MIESAHRTVRTVGGRWHDPLPRNAALPTLWAIVGVIVALALVSPVAIAQDKKLPEPEPKDLLTADGVTLKTTYYAPPKAGRETPIVVVLHMYGEGRNQKNWVPVATALQAKGIAALTVDLRGHGESVNKVGRDRQLDLKAFRLADYQAMVVGDMETVKRDLVIRHNAGQLNIERLGVVGAEMGASIAVLWSGWDWSNANGQRKDFTTIEGGKRGRDVKSLALLSPQYNFKGLRITRAHAALMASRMSVLIISGSESRTHRDAERLWKSIKQPGQDEHHQLYAYRAKLEGSDLLSEELGPKLAKDLIAEFMDRTLQQDLGPAFAWQPRRTPFGLQPE